MPDPVSFASVFVTFCPLLVLLWVVFGIPNFLEWYSDYEKKKKERKLQKDLLEKKRQYKEDVMLQCAERVSHMAKLRAELLQQKLDKRIGNKTTEPKPQELDGSFCPNESSHCEEAPPVDTKSTYFI